MIRKLTLAAGFSAGYVLGAKAGTQRYDQIMGKLRELAGQPAVQEVKDSLLDTAGALGDKAKDAVNETVAAVGDKVTGDKVTGDKAAGSEVVDLAGTAAKPASRPSARTGTSLPPGAATNPAPKV